jgi:hypothetical protein
MTMSYTSEEIKHFQAVKIAMIKDYESKHRKYYGVGIIESVDGNYLFDSDGHKTIPHCGVCGKELLEGTLIDPEPGSMMNYPRWFCSSRSCAEERSTWVYRQVVDYRDNRGGGDDSYMSQAIKAMNIPPAFHNKTLASLKGLHPIITELRQAIKNNQSIFISGAPGLGKSHLAVGLLIESGVRAPTKHRYTDTQKFLGEILSAIKTDVDYSSLINQMGDYHMLVLDDIGAEKTTEHVRAVINQIINDRIMNERLTIVTSNLSLEAIAEKFDQRLSSRLSGFKVVNMTGTDYRMKKVG